MRDAAFFLVWLAMLPVALRYAQAGVVLWAWVSLIAPNEQLYGFLTTVPFSKVTAALTLGVMFLNREKKSPYLDGALCAMLAMLLLALLSQVRALTVTDVGWDVLDKFAKIVLFVFVVTMVMQSRVRIHALVLTICLGIGFTGVTEGLKYLASGGHHVIVGLGSFGDNNHLAVAVLMTIPLLLYVYEVSALQIVRIACMGSVLLCALCVVATGSRGGFVGLLIVGFSVIAFSRHRMVYVMLFAVVALAIYQIVPATWTTRMDTISDVGQDSSFMGRVIAWKMSTLIALDHPLLGGGVHAVQAPDVWAAYRDSFYKLSFIPTDEVGLIPRAAHSIYFEILGDLGFAGLILYLLMMFGTWRNLSITRRLVSASGSAELDWAHRLATRLRISLLVLLVSGGLLSVGYEEFAYMFLGLSSVLRRVVQLEMEKVAAKQPGRSWLTGGRSPRPQPLAGATAMSSLGRSGPGAGGPGLGHRI